MPKEDEGEVAQTPQGPQGQVIGAHFRDPSDAARVRAAAEAMGVTPSTFVREAALAQAAKVAGVCPHCGSKRKSRRGLPQAGELPRDSR